MKDVQKIATYKVIGSDEIDFENELKRLPERQRFIIENESFDLLRKEHSIPEINNMSSENYRALKMAAMKSVFVDMYSEHLAGNIY
ncbi:hypothetical protein HYT25_02970 [Candidatus Pacearchaeota archaeon]|nr:hypothetical protein [Candidatus Pacearchaeota archaeon]